MKSKYAVIALTIAAAFWLTTGCGKKEEAAPVAQDAQKAVQQAAGEAQKAAEQQAPAVQQAAQQAAATAQQAAASAQQTAAAATTQAGTEAQSLIDKAKGLMADKKWVDALGTLKDAAGKQPTAEQKGLLDQLIAEVQKAMAGDAGTKLKSEATKALGGLLGK
jgi:L-lactate utilization protein LutB